MTGNTTHTENAVSGSKDQNTEATSDLELEELIVEKRENGVENIQEDGGALEKVEVVEDSETWLILVAVFPCNVILGMFWIAFPILYIQFSHEFDASQGTAGWIGSIQNGLQQLLGLISSSPIELYGCRVVTLVGSVVVASGIALSAFANSVGYLYVTYGGICGKLILS